tara:strand:- start:42 stop:551 length:510 start_codon:yes stop_codon:yes gene_type:complete
VSQVFIQENFFPTELHKEIVQLMINTEYEPPAKEKREMHKGAYWHQHVLPNNCDVQIEIKKLIKEKFNFKVLKFIESAYTMVGASDRPRPHIDQACGTTHQCLIYMHGEESTNNGTGFYHEVSPENLELSMHIGFKHNRAIFFSSDVYHSPLQWAGNGSFRYSICNFFT